MTREGPSDVSITVPFVNATPDQIAEDMKLKIVWAKRQKGLPGDISGFEPVTGD